MKKYIKYLSVIIVLIVASLPLSAQDKVIKKLVDGENQRIVIYGTSLSASKEGWPAMLEDSLNMLYPGTVEVINSAQAAMWSTWGVENLRERVLEYKPDMVIIEFAMNDAYLPYTTSIEAARLNLEYMVYRIRELYPECSILIQVMNMPIAEHKAQRPDIELYYDMYRKEAKKLNIPVFGLLDTNADPDEVNYGIPANDDATKSVQLICGILADAVVEAKGGTLSYAYNVASEDEVSMADALSTADKAEELRQIRQKSREDSQSAKKKTNRKPNKFVQKKVAEEATEAAPVEAKEETTVEENKE